MSENIEGQIKDLRDIGEGKDSFISDDAKKIFPDIEKDAGKLADEMEKASDVNSGENS